ncbi:hypothetical protein GCM10009734_89600 [Nonomuraea bangladeshensis]
MEAHPFPPSPALTCRTTWSTKSGMQQHSSIAPAQGASQLVERDPTQAPETRKGWIARAIHPFDAMVQRPP